MHRPDQSLAAAAHNRLRSDGTVSADLVTTMIGDSWKRSQSYGLSEDQRPHYEPLPGGDLALACDRAQGLILHARPVMETLYEQIVNTDSMIVLTDEQGLILHSLGDDDFLQRAEKVALRPGVVWSERTKGTNAIGTAIVENAPALVHGPEHFLTANHFLTCSAVPISDPMGDIIGVLDVTGDWRSYHRHTMALARMSAQLIENQLFQAAFPEAMLLAFHGRPEFLGTLCEGMVAFAPDGSMISANKSGLFQLNMGLSGLRSHTFSSLFGVSISQLLDRAHAGERLPLTMHTGVRVHAEVRLGRRLRHGPRLPAVVEAGSRRMPVPARPSLVPAGSWLERLKTGDAQMDAAITRIQRVLGRDISILVQGETGTGKEMVARAIHADSPRVGAPFVAVNCASIPDGLIESELFGYEEGAFTGARRKGCPGKIIQAQGGVLFLDEIGDMPLNLQARLLRVLQERVVTPLGSVKSYPVDVAIVCATNRKLKELIGRGGFREDLYYRLNGLLVTLPPLRSRTDLPAVVARILTDELKAAPHVTVAPEVLDLFAHHPWPGNLRQLANALRTALAMADEDGVLRREHLPDDFLEDVRVDDPPPPIRVAETPAIAVDGRLDEVEMMAIRRALQDSGGNVSATARRLGISRNTIYRKLALDRYSDPIPGDPHR